MSDAPERALLHWLLTEGRTVPDLPALLEAFGERLQRHTSAERIWFGTRLLHPQTAAYSWLWTAGQPVVQRELGYARFAELRDTIDSPVRRLERGALSVRFRRGGSQIFLSGELLERTFSACYVACDARPRRDTRARP